MTAQDPRTRDVHETHDRVLVARYAVDDELAPDETATVTGLLAQCAECAALVDDLRVVQHAVAMSPAPVRTRDFFLTPDQAEWLRPNPWQRFLSRFSAPSAATLRPLAGATLAIGIVLVGASAVLPRTSNAPASDQTAPVATGTAGPESLVAPDASASSFSTQVMLPFGSPSVAGDDGNSSQSRIAPKASPFADMRTLQDAQPSAGAADLVPHGASPGPLSVSSMQGVGGGSPPPAAVSGAAAASAAPTASTAEIAAPMATPPVTGDTAPQAEATAVAPSSDAVTQALLIAGVLLAIVSVAVLALIWLARRSTDPLLR